MDVCVTQLPCRHNAVCSQSAAQFVCTCRPGWRGERCETPCVEGVWCNGGYDGHDNGMSTDGDAGRASTDGDATRMSTDGDTSRMSTQGDASRTPTDRNDNGDGMINDMLFDAFSD